MFNATQARKSPKVQEVNVEEWTNKILKEIEGMGFQRMFFITLPYNYKAAQEISSRLQVLGFTATIDLGKYECGDLTLNLLVDWSFSPGAK